MDAERRSTAPPRAGGRSPLPASMGGRPRPARRNAGPFDPATIVEILSHELRSPITTINLGTKVLQGAGRGITGPVRAEVVAVVEAEAERLYQLVEDLLAVARHEDATASLAVRPLLLQHWMPEAVGAEVNRDRRLGVRLGMPPDLPPVLADDGALAQVVRNLLRNACLHAADGMPVEIVASQTGDEFVTLEFLDRGPGVDPRESERLFEPFYRSRAAEASGSGAGLGLTAARRLLRAMGGDIAASPREGGGARFTVRLAIAREDEDPGQAVSASPLSGSIPRSRIRAAASDGS
ncbi:MAG TPA: HAMP domain-containing sensor histidine kinase [Candidatus Limnocylindrales bacterium]|nr:HAMP domain-containing sensor histidine kinase [Candidatus Limnocylindrales bacterium]